jgi:hypothetical protein
MYIHFITNRFCQRYCIWGQVIIPTAHYSDSPLLRRPIIPTAHCSDSPFLRQPISPTTHYSVKNGQKQYNYLKTCCFSSIPNGRLTLIFILIERIVSVLNKRVNMGSKSKVMVLTDSLHHYDMRNISTNFGWSNTSTTFWI